MTGVDFDFSTPEGCLTVLGSKTIDTYLGIVYSKPGLDNATADKFDITNSIQINDKDIKQDPTKTKTK